MRFKIFFEADMGAAPPGGAMGAPPMGGMGGGPAGAPPGGSPLGSPMGGPAGGPLGMGGGGGGLGMDGGLGGPMGGMQPPAAGGDMTQVPIDVTTTSVWDIFEKLLSGQSNLPKEKLPTQKTKPSHLMQ